MGQTRATDLRRAAMTEARDRLLVRRGGIMQDATERVAGYA
jgi:hypothetical protein